MFRLSFFFLLIPRPLSSTLFPYTTLFRSHRLLQGLRRRPNVRLQPRTLLPDLGRVPRIAHRSEEHTSELQSHSDLVCRLLLEKKKTSEMKVPAGWLVEQAGSSKGFQRGCA